MSKKKIMKLASRGKRLGAYCIDAVVPVITCTVFIVSAIVNTIRSFSYMQGFGYGYGYSDPFQGYGYGYQSPASRGTSAAIVIALLLTVAYIIAQLVMYRKSMTLGKAALGLQVVSSDDGEPIGFWKMLFREWFVKQASGSVFLLGYIWVLIDDKNRGWHDKILDTYVVDLRESAAYNAAAGRTMPTVSTETQSLPECSDPDNEVGNVTEENE